MVYAYVHKTYEVYIINMSLCNNYIYNTHTHELYTTPSVNNEVLYYLLLNLKKQIPFTIMFMECTHLFFIEKDMFIIMSIMVGEHNILEGT